MTTETFSIYSTSQPSDTAETGLTAIQVVKNIYNTDGNGYRLEPRMVDIEDEDGNAIGEEQSTYGILGKEWDIYFTRAGQEYGEKSSLTAYGDTEEAAEQEFLQSAWNSQSWDDCKWMIFTDEQYKAEHPESDEGEA